MSKKVLRSMEEENPELQKQIGCISGFFQLFDRHKFLTNQRNTQNQNMPNQGGTNNHIKQQRNSTQKATAKNVKFARENQQFSTESSGTSLSSSSCSSSMSSLEFNRTIQIEPTSVCQMKIPGNSTSGAAMKQQHGNQFQSLDFFDIVKDSMNRNLQGLSVKTVTKEEKKSRILKYIDSPRPLQAAKPVNTGLIAWDSPRLSYDDMRNMQDTCKSATRNKELPRLSLDSRRPQKGNESSNTILKQMQEPESFKRPSSVVAKLMGLEPLPDLMQNSDTPAGISSRNIYRNETLEGSSIMSDDYKRHQSSASPRTSKGSQLQASKKSESSNKASNPLLTVYGEIEKRMGNLEFKNSGKDLRALQRILEAMQRYKESLDTTRDQSSNPSFDNRNHSNLSESCKVQSPRLQQKDSASVAVEMSNSSHGSKSPIFTMKPINVARKSNNPASTEMSVHGKSAKGISSAIRNVKDPIVQPFHSVDKSNKKRTSKIPQVITGENTTNTADTRSPRLQKKFGFERCSLPTSPSSDSSSNRRQHHWQSMELSSPSTTLRQKFPTLQERNDHFIYQKKDFKHEVGFSSPDCGSMRSMDSHSDIEDNQIDHSEKINSNYGQLKGLNQNNVAEELSKGSFLAEKIVTTEQPSPVSVLDAAFYREEPPSPVKKKSDITKDLDESLNSYDSSENTEDFPLSSNKMKLNFSNGTCDFDLKTQKLFQVLQQIDHNDERFTSFNNNKDADHKYISEILFEKISKMSNPEKMQRKLMFDVINDILVEKLTLKNSSTLLCKPNQPAGKKLRGEQLLDEIFTEIDNLQDKNRNFSLANEDEKVTSLLFEDLSRCATIYTDCYGEVPKIVLDIERLIFKDLITDLVRGELANQSGKHCRQLHFLN